MKIILQRDEIGTIEWTLPPSAKVKMELDSDLVCSEVDAWFKRELLHFAQRTLDSVGDPNSPEAQAFREEVFSAAALSEEIVRELKKIEQ